MEIFVGFYWLTLPLRATAYSALNAMQGHLRPVYLASLGPPPLSRDNHLLHLIDEDLGAPRGGISARYCGETP